MIRDGREWLVSSGFPGVRQAIFYSMVLLMLGGLPLHFLIKAWSAQTPASMPTVMVVFDVVFRLFQSVILGAVVLATFGFALYGLYRWCSTFWISCDDTQVHLRRVVFGGLIRRERTISCDDIAFVKATFAGLFLSSGKERKIATHRWQIDMATKSGKPGSRDVLAFMCREPEVVQGLTNLLRKRSGLPTETHVVDAAIEEAERQINERFAHRHAKSGFEARPVADHPES